MRTSLSRLDSHPATTLNSLRKIHSINIDQGLPSSSRRDIINPSLRSISKTSQLPKVGVKPLGSKTIREQVDLMKKHEHLMKRKEMSRSAKLKPLTQRSLVSATEKSNSYLLIQKRKQVEPSAAKISWQSLQNMKLNDIKGYFHDGFEPRDLIEKDGAEDTEFLPEYLVTEATTERPGNKVKQYGAIETWQAALAKGRNRVVPQTVVSRSMAIRRSQQRGHRDIRSMLHA